MTRFPSVIVVMGVSGSGKSTFGLALADSLNRPFIDADNLHSSANKTKMASGIPLDDADRWPWLDTVAATATETGESVVACSALRRCYRDRIRESIPSATFVHLDVDRDELTLRMTNRAHEFMPVSLLNSQLETLEPMEPDEAGFCLAYSNGQTIIAAVTQAKTKLIDAHVEP